MFRDNIADTELSGLAEIVKASRTSTDGKVPAPTTGYVHFRYEVRVVKWFHGAQPSERIVLTQGAEASSTELPPGNLLFFSACKSNDGGWEPDVGYFFPIEDACRAKVEGIGEAAAKRVHSGGKRKARACTPPKK